MNSANGRRLPLPVVDLGEQLVDVRGPQVAQAYATEVRHEVVVDVVPVRAERRRAPARPLLELHPQLAVGQLAAASTKAVATLVDALDNEKGQARVQAARVLLDAVLALRESLDLEQRLAALEAAGGDAR
uniref:Uncharacterized protein n=1 Tax=Streptomyces sp. NBC_00049 TaxID=2903617 RepID=A0AAU2JP75_9ACTN